MSEDRPTPREVVAAFLPGALQPKLLIASSLALALAVTIAILALLWLSNEPFVAVMIAALFVWGQGAGWLVDGELRGLTTILADLSGGVRWATHLTTWWLPVTVVWGVAGAVLSGQGG